MSTEIIDVQGQQDLSLNRDPNVILHEAKKAATALMTVVSQKKKPVIMNGEQYLEFEDWQTVAQFYGLSVKVSRTSFVDFGGVKGYEATAECIRNYDGMVLSSAEAMCLNDEDKWSTRTKYELVNGVKTKVGEVAVPMFQLRSMAQTRACAKAFRNKLAWVVVLAGFKPTPAEEMQGIHEEQKTNGKPEVSMPKEKQEKPISQPTHDHEESSWEEEEEVEGETKKSSNPISDPQGKRLYAIAMGNGRTKESFNEELKTKFNYASSRDIDRGDYERICTHFSSK